MRGAGGKSRQIGSGQVHVPIIGTVALKDAFNQPVIALLAGTVRTAARCDAGNEMGKQLKSWDRSGAISFTWCTLRERVYEYIVIETSDSECLNKVPLYWPFCSLFAML